MEQYSLRRARPEDVDAAMTICKACQQNPYTHWTDEYPNRAVFAQDVQEGALYLLLENETPLGIGVVMDHDDVCDLPLAFAGKKPCVLARLGVLPRAQGKGLGKKLLCLLEQAGIALGYDSARLLCDEENPITNRLYHHAGYADRGRAELYGSRYCVYEKCF